MKKRQRVQRREREEKRHARQKVFIRKTLALLKMMWATGWAHDGPGAIVINAQTDKAAYFKVAALGSIPEQVNLTDILDNGFNPQVELLITFIDLRTSTFDVHRVTQS